MSFDPTWEDTKRMDDEIRTLRARAERAEKERDEAKVEVEDLARLIDKQSDILRRTANALHDGPLEDGYWSHHDLPELAARLREALTRFFVALEFVQKQLHEVYDVTGDIRASPGSRADGYINDARETAVRALRDKNE